MLDGLRTASKSWIGKAIMTVVFGVIIVSFAIWGIGDIFRAPHAGSSVAEVDGTDIPAREVSNEFDLRLRQMQQVAWVCGLEYDVDEDLLDCDPMFASVFGINRTLDLPQTLSGFLAFVSAEDRGRVTEALTVGGVQSRRWGLHCVRANGELFPAELALEFRAREIGTGLIANGTLRDEFLFR